MMAMNTSTIKFSLLSSDRLGKIAVSMQTELKRYSADRPSSQELLISECECRRVNKTQAHTCLFGWQSVCV